ncbi:MAG: DUF4411 domain-containing protein [Pseudonocardiales bacterium]|nr:MAG: DUF4411 domain-containing protein [Pseudonocardiales bacterium]
MAYCFDTSALLQCWARYYPMDVFPGLWDRLDAMIRGGELVAPDEVGREIAKQDDGLNTWVKDRPELLIPLDDEIQRATSDVLDAFPELVKELSGRNQADPFVVALARVRGLTVVTQEKGGSQMRPRIPMVCRQVDVECMDVVSFIRDRGWTF